MEALYYPYSRCLSLNHLKKTLLLFDELVFLDTELDGIRFEILRKYQHGYDLNELQRKLLMDAYDYLKSEKLIRIQDPTRVIRKYDALITTNINSDLRNKEFCDTAICHSTNTWSIMRARLPKSFQLSLDPRSMTFDEALLLQDVIRCQKTGIRLPDDSTRFYIFLKKYGQENEWLKRVADAADSAEQAEELFYKEYSHTIGGNPCIVQKSYEVPFLQASSLRINEALIFCLEQGLIPITDSPVHSRLLNIKAQQAISLINKGIDSNLMQEFDLPYHVPKRDIAIRIIDKLVPEEIFENMTIEDVVKYKNKHREQFIWFSNKVSQLSATLNEAINDPNYDRSIQRIIDKDVLPEIDKIKIEFSNTLSKDFGKVVLQSAGIIVPILYTSILGGLSIKDILIACALGEAGYLSTTGAPLLMENLAHIKSRKSSAFAYVLGLK